MVRGIWCKSFRLGVGGRDRERERGGGNLVVRGIWCKSFRLGVGGERERERPGGGGSCG